MANDAEMDISVTFDENDFLKSFDAVAAQMGKKVSAAMSDALSNIKGPATKNWNELPFYSMHSGKGNMYASAAFTSSLARDLQYYSGMSTSSAAFSGAMLHGVYRSSMPDEMARYHMLASMGYGNVAALAGPGTSISKIISNNYRLMEQPWARDFITTKTVPVLTPTGRQKRHKGELVTANESVIDFAAMREHAVATGIGRWLDPDGENNAENFEFIDDTLESISKKADKSKDLFLDWHQALKGVLGTLTAIGGLAGTVATINNLASKQVAEGASTVPNTLPFFGMNAEDYLRSRNASKALNLGNDAIYNDIAAMATKRAEFKTYGTGFDVVSGSLAGVFNTINETSDPMTAYKAVAQALADKLTEIRGNKDPEVRADQEAQLKMLIGKIGLGTLGEIAGYLNTPAGANLDVESLFALTSNPYYGALDTAKTIQREIEKINTSISASYTALANDWMDKFGVPFLNWWDKTLKEKIVPWFVHEEGDAEDADALLGFMGRYNKFENAFKRASNNQSGYLAIATSNLPESYKSGALTSVYGSKIRDTSYANAKSAAEFRNLWDVIKDTAKNAPAGYTSKKRAQELMSLFKDSGYADELNNFVVTDADKYLAKFAQAYLSTYSDEQAQALLENFTDSLGKNIVLELPEFKELIDFMKTNYAGLGSNFANEIIVTIKDAYGNTVASEVERVLQSAH